MLASSSTATARPTPISLSCTIDRVAKVRKTLKNLLDWTVGGGQIYGKPVGWIDVAMGGRGTGAEEHSPRCCVTSARSPSSRPVSACPSRGTRPGPTGSSPIRPSAPRSGPR